MKTLLSYLRLVRLTGVLLYGVMLALAACILERFTHGRLALRQRLCSHFMKALAAALPFKVRVEGHLPDEPMLWISNHVSWTDIPFIGQLAPLSFLSKAEVREWPLAGWLARHGGTLFIRRGAGELQSLNSQIGEYLDGSHPVVLFPEGTTSDGLSLLPFHGRLLTAAVERGVPLQPVAIAYRRNGLPCPIAPFIGDDALPTHLLRMMRAERAEVVITLLPPVSSQGLGRTELARQARRAIYEALDLPETSAANAA
ncbi:lysophospholipid acyltransferase family protein [Pseudomonas sp. Marseille-QA0892]